MDDIYPWYERLSDKVVEDAGLAPNKETVATSEDEALEAENERRRVARTIRGSQ